MKLLPKYKRRFSSGCYCRFDCLDQIFYFINGSIAEKSLVEFADNTLKTLIFLKEKSLNFIAYIPLISLLSPFIWRIIICHRKQILFSIKKLKTIEEKIQKKAFLYHLTAYQLYGIEEEWTHCVCEFFQDNKVIYYDPYLTDLKKEYSSLLKKYTIPTHNDLVKFSSIKILIW